MRVSNYYILYNYSKYISLYKFIFLYFSQYKENFKYLSIIEISNNRFKYTYELTEENLEVLDFFQTYIKEDKTSNIKFQFKSNDENVSNIFGDQLEKLLNIEKSQKELKYSINYEDYSKFNFMKGPGEVGLELIDVKLLEKSKKIFGYLLSSFGKSFLKGKDLTRISLPIYISDYRTYLEVNSYFLKNSFPFLIEAALQVNQIERMKILTKMVVSALHSSFVPLKPFNPILGETFQSEIVLDTENFQSLKVYFEQISHHPPITAIYAKHDLFKIYGYRQPTSIIGGNNIETTINGKFNIVFNDNTIVTMKYGLFEISGLVIGEKRYNFKNQFVIENVTHSLISFFDVNPIEKKGFFEKIFSNDERFPDYIKGYIVNSSEVKYDVKEKRYDVLNNKVLSKYEGEYMSFLDIDNKRVWSIEEPNKKSKQYKMSYTLPSDSRNRGDLLLYKANNNELAQYAKILLENNQRKDEKLRKNEKID